MAELLGQDRRSAPSPRSWLQAWRVPLHTWCTWHLTAGTHDLCRWPCLRWALSPSLPAAFSHQEALEGPSHHQPANAVPSMSL